MYFCGRKRILFSVLLQLKGIFSTQEIRSENDVTKHLNESITNIFAIGVENTIKLLSTVKDYKLQKFEHNIKKKVGQFENKIFFQNITIEAYVNTKSDEWKPPQIHWEFVKNKMNIFFEELRFILQSALKAKKTTCLRIYPSFRNFTLTAVRSNIKGNLSQISYNTTYYRFSRFSNWKTGVPEIYLYMCNETISSMDLKQLAQQMMPALLAMIHENLHNNRNFSQTLEEIFQEYEKPRKEIISNYPDFLSNPQRYYYLIPENPFFCFILKDIVISGLSNFESFKFIRTTSEIFTHTLLIRDIQGKMTLDYRTENESDLELGFQIDCLFVSKKDDSGCSFAQAKYYTVTRTKTNATLNDRQSEVIMNGLESAIVSSLLPSMKIGRTCDLETPLDKIDISNSTDWKTIKESYKGWIPFNDDDVIPNQPSIGQALSRKFLRTQISYQIFEKCLLSKRDNCLNLLGKANK